MKPPLTLEIPKQLALLCDLLDTTPQEILQGFIDDLSLEVHSSGSDERRMAVEYFMRVSYGIHLYEWDQIQQMFDDLNWLRLQWPGNDEVKEKQYLADRKAFLKRWFKEWKSKQDPSR